MLTQAQAFSFSHSIELLLISNSMIGEVFISDFRGKKLMNTFNKEI